MSSTALALLILATDTSNSFKPMFPVGLLAWIVSYRNRKDEIGGFLLYFFWSLYGGILTTVLFFFINLQSYVPENFDDHRLYHLFLWSEVPGIFLLLAQGVIATMLLAVRTWDMLRLFRLVMILTLASNVLAVAIDASNENLQDNIGIEGMSMATGIIWLCYLFVSRRVKHVFLHHDWYSAVHHFYPEGAVESNRVTPTIVPPVTPRSVAPQSDKPASDSNPG